ncbi:MAG: urease accessory protein UreE [Rhodomicrobium sp.]
MLRIESIIGSSSDEVLEDKLHYLDHSGIIEFVVVQQDDLERRRLRARTEAGEEVAITLPRDQRLYDGAVLYLDEHRAIIIRSGDQRWLRFSPRTAADALELGYAAGNLHWRVRFDGRDLMVAQNGPKDTYLARLQHLISVGRVNVQEDPK